MRELLSVLRPRRSGHSTASGRLSEQKYGGRNVCLGIRNGQYLRENAPLLSLNFRNSYGLHDWDVLVPAQQPCCCWRPLSQMQKPSVEEVGDDIPT